MKMSRLFMSVALSALFVSAAAAQQQLSPMTSPAHSRAPMAVPLTDGNKKVGLVDINSASPSQLDALPGMNANDAQAIVANRPYKAKDELAQRNIIPPKVYDQIKDRIVAVQASSNAASSGSTTPPPSTGTGTAK